MSTPTRAADLGYGVRDNGGCRDECLATFEELSTTEVQAGRGHVDCVNNADAVVVVCRQCLGAVEVVPDRERQIRVGPPDVHADQYGWQIVHMVLAVLARRLQQR